MKQYHLASGTLAGCLILAAAGISGAQTLPVPLQKTNALAQGQTSAPKELTVAGGKLFFIAGQPGTGEELWCSDGTAAGTQVLKDIFPGRGSSSPHRLLAHANGIFFRASDPQHGCEWWTSDGTAAGTHLLEDVSEGTASTPGSNALVTGGKLWFFTPSPTEENSWALWTSDGTAAGTKAVAEGIVSPYNYVGVGDKLFFTQSGGGGGLWKSDGTLAGTVRVGEAPGFNALHTAVIGDTLFMASNQGSSSSLWKTDGTAQGTVKLKEFSKVVSGNYSFATDLTVLDGKLFFTASDAATGFELWTSDGTPQGTKIAFETLAGSSDHGPRIFGVMGSSMYLKTYDNFWISDGTQAGTLPLQGPKGKLVGNRAAIGDSVAYLDIFSAGEMVRSDGSAAGSTVLPAVKKTLGKKETRELMVTSGNDLYFLNRSSQKSQELWFLSATSKTPLLLKTFADRNWFDPDYNEWLSPETAVIGEKVFFAAHDLRSLWSSDGTKAGTRVVSRVKGKIMGIDYSTLENFQVHDGRLYFASKPSERYNYQYQLNWTDGTPRGTGTSKTMMLYNPAVWELPLLRAPIGDYYAFGLFMENPADSLRYTGVGLKGERKVLPGQEPLVAPGEAHVFAYDDNGEDSDSLTNSQLWVCDGSTGGTRPLDLGSSFQGPFQVRGRVGNLTYFTARHTQEGFSLFVTEGTEASTRAVLNIFTAGDPNLYAHSVWGFTAYQGEAFFLFEGKDLHGIWRSDGTKAGTRRIKSLQAMPYYISNVFPTSPVEMNGQLYFTCQSPDHGAELWKSDGTTDGTLLAVDIVPGYRGSKPQGLVAGDSVIYFSADDGIHGRELWQSDGTPAGTRMVVDLTDGDGQSSAPVGLVRTSQKLFFLAYVPGAGAERTLHAMDIE